MDLELTPDQRDVAEAFGRVLARDSSTERVRAAEAAGFDPLLWKALAGMGAFGLTVPAEAGGGGAGFVELALVAEAAGRRLACVPLAEAAVAAGLLADAGAKDVAAEAATGERLVVFAVRPTGPAPAGHGAANHRATGRGAAGEEATARLVPGGAVADAVIALDGDELVLAAGAPGGPVRDLGFQAAADRPLSGPGVDRRVLATGDSARELWTRARDRWRLGAAALCAGMAAEALDIAVRYAAERQQFGVPIGSFQALQQPLADVAMAVDGAQLVAREAAWRHDNGLDSWPAAAAVAFAHAAATAVRAAELCLHVHGGYGYTLEYDAQLYLRRAKAIRLGAGDPDLLWEEIGATAMAKGAA